MQSSKLIFGFDEWMLDLIHYHEMNMEQAMQLAHICYDEDEYDTDDSFAQPDHLSMIDEYEWDNF